ncbi:hypothetical protein [Streptomyces sp. TRM68367]|uniref:hypothetical protein n=1 Tax=Streptomyces sp. TRM68367 TaxID=2758415 RepID=UPI00165B44B6|nr:hypothetical protein [Streptomyces sp. TRM68367]MBC9725259.1 hypothetical protein [Streptomyces sp. TRM68367]
MNADRYGRVVALAPRSVNALASVPWVTRVAKALGGIAPERDVPVFAEQRFTDWCAALSGGCLATFWQEYRAPQAPWHRAHPLAGPGLVDFPGGARDSTIRP